MEFPQNFKAAQDAGITKEEFLEAPHTDELPMSKTENLIYKQIQKILQEVAGVKEELRMLQAKFITIAENETIKQQSEGAVSGNELRNEMQKLEHLISSGFEAHNRSLKSFVTQEIDALKASLEDKFDFFSETSSDVVDYAGNIDSEMASQSIVKEDPGEKSVEISSSQHHEEQDHIEITNEDFVDMKRKTLQESIESDKKISEKDSGCLKTDQAHQQEKEESQTAELGLEFNRVDVTNKIGQESSDSVSKTDIKYLKTNQGHEQEEGKSQSAELGPGLNTTEETTKIHRESNGSGCKVSETDHECLGTLEDSQRDEEQTQATELSLETVDVTKEAVEESGGSVEGDQKVKGDQQPEKDPLEDISFDLVDDYQRVPEENTDSEAESREPDSEILGGRGSNVQDNDQSEENLQTEKVGQDSVVIKNTSSRQSIGFDVSSSTIDSESKGVDHDQQQEEEKVLEEEKDLNTGTELFKVPVESSDLDASTQEIAQACTSLHEGDQTEEINLQNQEQTMKVIDVRGQSFNKETDSESSNQIADGEGNEEELRTFQNKQELQEDPVLEVQSLESTDSYHTALDGSIDSETGSHPADPESPDEFVALEDDQQTDTKMQTGEESQAAVGMTNKGLPESSSSDACTQGMEQKCVGDQCETKTQDNKIQTDLAVAYDPKMNKEMSNENENNDSGEESRQETDEEGPDDTFELEKKCPPIDTAEMSHEPGKECTDSDAGSQTKDKEKFGKALEHEECLQKENLPMEGADKSNVKSDEDTDSDASCHETDQRDSGSASQHEKNLKKEYLPKAVADMDNESSDEYTDSGASSQASDERDLGNVLEQEESLQSPDEEGIGNALEHEESLQKERLPTDAANISDVKRWPNASSESGVWSKAVDKQGHEDTSEDVETLQNEHLLTNVADENNESSNGQTDPDAISQTKNESCSDDVLQHEESLQKENRPKDIGDVDNESSDESSNSDASSQTTDEGGPDNTLEHEDSLQKEVLLTDAADMSNVKYNESTESGALIKALDEKGPCEALEHEKGLQREDLSMNAGDMSNESSDENSDSDGSGLSTEGEGTGDALEHEHPPLDGADKSNVKSNDSTESGAGSQVTSEKGVRDTMENNESSQKEYLPKGSADTCSESSNEGTDSDATSEVTDEEDSDDVLQHEECRQQEYLPGKFCDVNDESSDESSDSDASGEARDEEGTVDTFQHEESLQKEFLPMDDNDKNKESTKEKFDSDPGSKATDDEGSDIMVTDSHDNQKLREVFQKEDESIDFVQVYHKTAEEGVKLEQEKKAESSVENLFEPQDGQQIEDQLQTEHLSQDYVVVNNKARQDRASSDDNAQANDLACLANCEDQYEEENSKKELTLNTEDVKKQEPDESIDCDESVSKKEDGSLNACQQKCEKVMKEDLGLHEKYTDSDDIIQSMSPLYATGCPKSLYQEGILQDQEMAVSSAYEHTGACTENTNSDVGNQTVEERNSDETMPSKSSQPCEEDSQNEKMSFEFVDLNPKTHAEGYNLEANRQTLFIESTTRYAVCDLQEEQQPKVKTGAEEESHIPTVVKNKASQDITGSGGTIRTKNPGRQCATQAGQIEKEKSEKQEVGYAKTQERTNSAARIQGIDQKSSGSQHNGERLSQKGNGDLFISSPKTLTSVQRKYQRSTEDHEDGQQSKEKPQTEEMNYSSQKLSNSEAEKYAAKMVEIKERSFLNVSEDKSPEMSNQVLTKPSTEKERTRIGDSYDGSDSQFQDASNKPSVASPLSFACKTMDDGNVKVFTSSSHEEADIAKVIDDAMEKDEPMLGKCTQQFEVTDVKTMLMTPNPFFTHHFYIHPKPFKVRLRLSFNSRGRFDVSLLVAEGKCDRLTKLPMVLNGRVSILNASSGRYTKLCEINNEEFAKPNQRQEIGFNLRVALKTCRRVYHDVTYHTLKSKGFIFHNGMRFKCEIEADEKTPTSQ